MAQAYALHREAIAANDVVANMAHGDGINMSGWNKANINNITPC